MSAYTKSLGQSITIGNLENINKLNDWKHIADLIPSQFRKTKKLKQTGLAGFFSASLELTKEGIINIMQDKNFDKIHIKERK